MKMMRVFAAALCILMTVTLCCCGDKEQLSDKYLVGYNFGDSGYDSNDNPVKKAMEVRICYDGTVDVFAVSSNGNDSTYDIAGSYQLTDDEINRLTSVIDQSELLNLNPMENGDVCDGVNKILYLYDKEGLVLKRCGGYMPGNEKFIEMYKTVQNVLHYEEQSQIYNEWLG